MFEIPARAPGDFRASGRWIRLILAAGALAYAWFIGEYTTVAAGGSDSSGYLNSARLLAEGRWRAELRVPPGIGPPGARDPRHFAPQGFNLFTGHPDLAPTYPTGLPLHLALAGRGCGWNFGPWLVQWGGALLAVVLLYAAAREMGIAVELAGAGAAVLALFPVFLFTSVQTLSDTLATTWVLAAGWAALRSARGDRWAYAAGAAFAMAVLVRPTNLAAGPGLLLLLGMKGGRIGRFLLGGVPGACWMAGYNTLLYGGVTRSGYGDITAAFGWEWLGPTAPHFGRWMATLLPAGLLVLPVVTLADPAGRRREVAGLLVAAGGIVGVYLFYDVSHDAWWCLRFILPAVALLILAGLCGAESLVRRARERAAWVRPLLAVGIAAWAAAGSWHWTRALHVLYVPDYEQAYVDMGELVGRVVPERGLVVCSVFSGALYYYTRLPALVYDGLGPEEFRRYAVQARAAGRPIYAVLFDLEEEEVLQRRCPGAWRRIGQVRKIGLWRLY